MELDSCRVRELEPGSCRGFPIGCGVNIFRASATPNFWVLGVALRNLGVIRTLGDGAMEIYVLKMILIKIAHLHAVAKMLVYTGQAMPPLPSARPYG